MSSHSQVKNQLSGIIASKEKVKVMLILGNGENYVV
jgi:hypothetical protein